MHVTLKASSILVGLVALLSILVYATGLHKSFMAGQAVFLVGASLINVAVVYWALRQTAADHGYGRQLLNSAVIGVTAGVLIVLVSWLLLSLAFPDVLEESRQAAIEFMQKNGTQEDEFQRQVDMLEKTTPMSQSVPGGIGTFFTSVLSGAVIAFFKRKT